jgi:NADPH2:quinone reductase
MTSEAPVLEAFRMFEASAMRLEAKAVSAESIAPKLEARMVARASPGDAVVEIRAAAVNPSDVKAAMGLMPYAKFPRTPGRDFAGIVVDGPENLIGTEVFGSSGDLGIRRDGTHGSHLSVEAAALVRIPAGLSLDEAAGIGVPFVTAWEGFRRSGLPKSGEIVLIMGINGKVGQAAAQMASWQGAKVIGVTRKSELYAGHASGPIEVIDGAAEDVAARVREISGGHGADIVFNTVGDPAYRAAPGSLAIKGRQIFSAAVDKIVSFDIFAFYRGRHSYVGIDTLALSSIETADVLRELLPGFANGALKPFPINANAVYPLRDLKDAYRAVLGSSRDRVILKPGL